MGYDGMLKMMTSSAMMKLFGNGPGKESSEEEREAWIAKIRKFQEGSGKYMQLSKEDEELLKKG